MSVSLPRARVPLASGGAPNADTPILIPACGRARSGGYDSRSATTPVPGGQSDRVIRVPHATVLVAILAERKLLGRMQLRARLPTGLAQSEPCRAWLTASLAREESITPGGIGSIFVYFVAPIIFGDSGIHRFRVHPVCPEVSVLGHRTPLQIIRPSRRRAVHPGTA